VDSFRPSQVQRLLNHLQEVNDLKLRVEKGNVRAEKAEKMLIQTLYNVAISDQLAVTQAHHDRGVLGDPAHPYLHLN
jgi:hypothetical protein